MTFYELAQVMEEDMKKGFSFKKLAQGAALGAALGAAAASAPLIAPFTKPTPAIVNLAPEPDDVANMVAKEPDDVADMVAKEPDVANIVAKAPDKVIYGTKVSDAFKAKVLDISKKLNIDPNHLMAVMAFETGETFSSHQLNKAGSGAVGLIQFMPDTAKQLGTSVEQLSQMTPEAQLDYVYKYLLPYADRIQTMEDLYLAVLYPKAIGKNVNYSMFKTPTRLYNQNRGLDTNKNGTVTPREATKKIWEKYYKGHKFIG